MKEDFTQYDIKPTGFLNYLRYYGEHFNKKLCEFACKQLKIKDYSKDNLESLFQTHNITMPEVTIYDLSYIANWCKKIFIILVYQMKNIYYYL